MAVRRSGRRASVISRVSAIAHGGRTSNWFDPPSLEAIRSGFHRAIAARAQASELREVSTDSPAAPHACASGRNQRGGASCNSATSHWNDASFAPNSVSSGRLTWTWSPRRHSPGSRR
jgi:hypothetical protein